MRKTIIIIIALLVVACKKERTCICTITENNGTKSTSEIVINQTKSEAKRECALVQGLAEGSNDSTKVTCELK